MMHYSILKIYSYYLLLTLIRPMVTYLCFHLHCFSFMQKEKQYDPDIFILEFHDMMEAIEKEESL